MENIKLDRVEYLINLVEEMELSLSKLQIKVLELEESMRQRNITAKGEFFPHCGMM